jgi:hypothetical protein
LFGDNIRVPDDYMGYKFDEKQKSVAKKLGKCRQRVLDA